jgi:hypothetical protein
MAGPPYLLLGGAQCYAQPFDCENARLFGFLLDADGDALRRLCDERLNQPSGGKVRYHPLAPVVLLAAAEIERVHVGMTDGREFYTPEIDVAFWVPLVAFKTVAGIEIAERFVWFLPYLFVDNTWAVASGREIYGFPKETSTFTQDLQNTGGADQVGLRSLVVTTAVVERFGRESPVQNLPILSIRRTDTGGGGLTRVWSDIKEAGTEIFRMFRGGGPGTLTLPGLGLVVELAKLLAHGSYPMAFLRQFPSVADGLIASSQAIIEAQVTISNFHVGGPMPGTYEVTIGKYESHPIVRDLGLAGSAVTAAAAWHMAFDFRMENGTVLWSASGGG